MFEKLTFGHDSFSNEAVEDPPFQGLRKTEGGLVCVREAPVAISCLEIGKNFTFGRDLLSDHDHTVSKAHFEICGGRLHDLGSANGTYVNGKRTVETALKPGDQIQAGLASMQYMGHFLICRFEHHGDEPAWAKPCVLPAGTCVDVSAPAAQTFSLESWSMQAAPEKTSLFLSCGSSLLMCASALVSAGIMAVVSTTPTETLFTSMIMSVSMSAGFFLYGVLSRNINWKKGCQKSRELEEGYLRYLSDLENSIVRFQQAIETQQLKTARSWHDLDDCLFQSGSDIPIGWKCKVLTTLNMPSFSWQHRQHPLFAKAEHLQTIASRPLRILEYTSLDQPVLRADPEAFFASVVFTRPPSCKLHGFKDRGFPHQYHDRQFLDAPEPFLQIGSRKIALKAGPGIDIDLERLKRARFTVQPGNELPPLYDGCDLRIRLGQNDDGPVYLDLKNDGPHGLVVGTTGSGKSELLSTLLCGLISRNSPDHLRFILVDFKGGSFSRPFEDVPHHAGVMTDLSAIGLGRLVTCLKGEIIQREKAIRSVLEDHPSLTADLDSCQPWFAKTIPHLVVIVDEFAQLKAQYPEKLDFLQEIARTGRSLGIHLILSTQKPSGIVSAQILANTGFILACRVNDAFESMELIGTKEASALDRPGTCILSVQGANVRFQTDHCRKIIRRPAQIMRKCRIIWQQEGAEKTLLDRLLLQVGDAYDPEPLLLAPTESPENAFVRVYDDLNHETSEIELQPGRRYRVICPGQTAAIIRSISARYPTYVKDQLPAGSLWFAQNLSSPHAMVFKDELPAALSEAQIDIVLETVPHNWDMDFEKTFVCGTRSALSLFGKYGDCVFPDGFCGNCAIRFHESDKILPVIELPDLDGHCDWARVFAVPVIGQHDHEPVFITGPLEVWGPDADEVIAHLRRFGLNEVRPYEAGTCPVLYTTGWQDHMTEFGLSWSRSVWMLKMPSGVVELAPLHYG